MGVELHISRADHSAENEGQKISGEEWLAYVKTDPELQLCPENGDYFVLWSGPSKYSEPWLDWFDGTISTKWPDTALYRKMLQIARCLDAAVRDDDGNVYVAEGDWEFDPTAPRVVQQPVPWWRRLFGA